MEQTREQEAGASEDAIYFAGISSQTKRLDQIILTKMESGTIQFHGNLTTSRDILLKASKMIFTGARKVKRSPVLRIHPFGAIKV